MSKDRTGNTSYPCPNCGQPQGLSLWLEKRKPRELDSVGTGLVLQDESFRMNPCPNLFTPYPSLRFMSKIPPLAVVKNPAKGGGEGEQKGGGKKIWE